GRDSLYQLVWRPIELPIASTDTDVIVEWCTGGRAAVHRALAMVRESLAAERPGRLIFVTRRAVAVDTAEDIQDPASAAVWGLIRSAQSEHPGRFALVDGDDARSPAVAAAVRSGEPQLVVRDGVAYVPRLVPASVVPGGRLSGRVLVTGASGLLGSLVARHLVVRHDVRDLVLLSRRGIDPGFVAELTNLGARVTEVRCDIGDRESVAALAGL